MESLVVDPHEKVGLPLRIERALSDISRRRSYHLPYVDSEHRSLAVLEDRQELQKLAEYILRVVIGSGRLSEGVLAYDRERSIGVEVENVGVRFVVGGERAIGEP